MAKDFAAFAAQARADGYDEVLERHWDANAVAPAHTHPFAVQALLVQGEMWLGVAGHVRHLLPGDRFALDAEVLHDERYGPDGATYWAARRAP